MDRNKEQIILNAGNNFHYITRGVERTPANTMVELIACNDGIKTTLGTIDKTITYGLVNADGYFKGQMIAWSLDKDDLVLFAIEQNWVMDDPIYRDIMGYR